MKILVSGASGLIGSAFSSAASRAGHTVVALVRKKGAGVFWDPRAGTIDERELEGVEAVVHLAGENIAAGRWNTTRKARILDSRVKGTALLSKAISKMKAPPTVMVSGSAIGIYGDCGDRILKEDSPSGSGFLADVCREWEQATNVASKAGIRVVHLRTGIVLAKGGGALAKMLLPFKLGVGGKIGSGRQYMSWIDLEDEVRVILHCIETPSIQGPVNSVGPSPATNAEFTRTLGRVLSRPTLLPLPAFAARLVLGEMADALLLSSQRVEPAKLLSSGHVFRHTNLEDTLRGILK
jgi:uncharacterized protein (TIGR01777 family)